MPWRSRERACARCVSVCARVCAFSTSPPCSGPDAHTHQVCTDADNDTIVRASHAHMHAHARKRARARARAHTHTQIHTHARTHSHGAAPAIGGALESASAVRRRPRRTRRGHAVRLTSRGDARETCGVERRCGDTLAAEVLRRTRALTCLERRPAELLKGALSSLRGTARRRARLCCVEGQRVPVSRDSVSLCRGTACPCVEGQRVAFERF
jgi:hypothetical protein